jgi:uncharacterized protein (UPF0335 family)
VLNPPLFVLFGSGSRRQIRHVSNPGTLHIPPELPDGRRALRRTGILRIQGDGKMAGKWFSRDSAKYFTIFCRFQVPCENLDTPLTHCLPHLPARLDATLQIIEFCGVKSTQEQTMSGPDDVAGDQLRTIVERIEQVEEEIRELNEARKEIYLEAKGNGFDVKVLREVIRVRKQDQKEREEHETLLDVYLQAIKGTKRPAKAA